MKRDKYERTLQDRMLAQLKINSPKTYTFVDRDSGGLRNTSSGWDFHLSKNGRIIYFECKVGKKPLTPWQKLTRLEIQMSGGTYIVLRFPSNVKNKNENFLINHENGDIIFCSEINIEWLGF